MPIQDKLWLLLGLFILGCALYEISAKNVTSLETVQKDYSSVTHTLYTVLFTIGLCTATYAILSIYVIVRLELNTCEGIEH